LRPTFGLGEDWNIARVRRLTSKKPLRSAFGSGENWNSKRAFNVILLTVSVSVCPT